MKATFDSCFLALKTNNANSTTRLEPDMSKFLLVYLATFQNNVEMDKNPVTRQPAQSAILIEIESLLAVPL
jgi:hypothetical protein